MAIITRLIVAVAVFVALVTPASFAVSTDDYAVDDYNGRRLYETWLTRKTFMADNRLGHDLSLSNSNEVIMEKEEMGEVVLQEEGVNNMSTLADDVLTAESRNYIRLVTDVQNIHDHLSSGEDCCSYCDCCWMEDECIDCASCDNSRNYFDLIAGASDVDDHSS